MSEPRISVIMPVYNRRWCVADAIESVLATGEPNLELLVVDDGSTDGTAELLAQYAAREPVRMRLLSHPGRTNHGIARSRNLAVAASRGEYLAFLDSDDIYLPERFRHAIAWLQQNPQFVGCIEPYSLAAMGDATSGRFVAHLTSVPAENQGWLKAMLFGNVYWTMPAITLRRVALPFYGAFDERLKFAEETALWLRLAALQQLGVAQAHSPIACVRRHSKHSWDPSDRAADCTTYLHVLLDVLGWAQQRSELAAETACTVTGKLRSYLIEILSDAELPVALRLRAWQRAVVACPALAADRRVAANLVRAPFRRQPGHAL